MATACDVFAATPYNFIELLCDSIARRELRRDTWSAYEIHHASTCSYRLACALSRASKDWHAAVRLYRSSLRTLVVKDLDDAGLDVIAKHCPKLRKFSFDCSAKAPGERDRHFSDAAVLAFFTACPLLESALLGSSFGSLAARTMLLLSRSLSCVTELDLSGMRDRHPSGEKKDNVTCKLTATSVSSFLTGCGQLNKLCLDGLPCITDELVWCIEPLHPSLCVLHLHHVPISDASLQSRDWPHLKELSLSSTDGSLTSSCFTGAYFPSLVALDIEVDVRGDRLTPLVAACPCLLGLRIGGGANNEASSLSDLVLPLLEMLDLSQNSSWAPQAYDGLSAANLPCLVSLSLNGGDIEPAVTSRTVQSIALHCPQLTELDCGYLDVIDDAAVQAVARHCLGLKSLVINFSSVTDAALLACTGLSDLSFLDLSHVRGVTDAGLRTVAEACPQLWSLGHMVEDVFEPNGGYDPEDEAAFTLDGYRAVWNDVLSGRAMGHNGDVTTQHLVFRKCAIMGYIVHSFV